MPISNSPPGSDSNQVPPSVSPDPTQPGAGGRTPSDGGAGGGAGGAEGPSEPGSGGSPTEGGAGGQSEGGAPSDGGASPTGSGGMVAEMGFDRPVMKGSGTSSEQYETALVSRNDVPFVLITNGWGPGFDSHTISWAGTSFIVEAMSGGPGPSGQPASYPTVFCGRYSVREVGECGLPKELSTLTSLRTGWRWTANGNTGAYNAAYDIWVGTGTRLEGYLMVWLRDPPGYQPAGSPNMAHQGVEVANVPGTWNVWNGTVNGLPIINWVRAEGEDSTELEFDVLDFIRDAAQRGLDHPGTHINAVAVGFEIWEGPISNLESVDFYVEVE